MVQQQQFELTARSRTELGTGASRRLRRAGGLPAVVYGAGKPVQHITLDHAATLLQLRSEAFHSHILKLNLDGQIEDVVLREVRYHPVRRQVLHMDLLRVSATQTLRIEVPLHFVGEDVAPGVKLGGGVVSHLMTSIEVECLPKDLPEFVEVDITGLELNDTLHLSDLRLPPGVTIPALALGPDHDLPVVAIHLARTGAEEEAAPAEGGAAAPGGEGGAA